MKITITLNKQKQKKEIPVRWEEVTFGNWIDLTTIPLDDDAGVLSVFTGIPVLTLKKVYIENLDLIRRVLWFLRTEMGKTLPKSILGYPVPKNLELQTIGQMADIQTIAETFPKDLKEGDPMPVEHMRKYADICTVYAMPDYLDASQEARDEFTKKFFSAPCQEVLAIGNFTLVKLIGSRMNITVDFQKADGPMRRIRLAIRGLLARLVSSLRFWRLRKLLRTSVTS